MSEAEATALDQKVDRAAEWLVRAAEDYSPATLANSLGAEDIVLTDLIQRNAPSLEVFTLDTGRLNEETYRLLQTLIHDHGIPIQVYFPDFQEVEEFVQSHGPNSIYESIERRKQCCFIRKVEPLRRALTGKRAWITGLRRAQSVTRREIEPREWDEDNGLYKFNPLYDWRQEDVWAYIRERDLPYNELHDRGYASIGCEPCTRPIAVGEDERAGRWWWEDPENKECGLHERSS